MEQSVQQRPAVVTECRGGVGVDLELVPRTLGLELGDNGVRGTTGERGMGGNTVREYHLRVPHWGLVKLLKLYSILMLKVCKVLLFIFLLFVTT